MNLFIFIFRLITRHKFNDLLEHRKELKYNSKLFLPPISSQFQERVASYNSIVKDVYGCYIESVAKCLSAMNYGQEATLPFTDIPFTQNTDYDDGTFEYNIHHHESQQIQNPSISPFAGVSGVTHEQFMSNYNSTVTSWDLRYPLDLSPKVVPFVDLDCRDHTNTAYHLNSYGLDFFKQGSEAALISENELSPDDTLNNQYVSIVKFE